MYVYIYIYTHMYIHMYVHMYCMYMYICVYVYTHVYINRSSTDTDPRDTACSQKVNLEKWAQPHW